MSLYSKLHMDDLQEIISGYTNQKIDSFSILTGGAENTNYKVTIGERKYNVTIFENKNVEQVNNLASLQQHLWKNKVSTTQILLNQDQKLTSIWQGKPVCIKEFVEAEVKKKLHLKELEAVGKEIGMLHTVPLFAKLPQKHAYGRSHFMQVKQYSTNSIFKEWMQKMAKEIANAPWEKLPKSIIHGDAFASNILIKRQNTDFKIVLIDFEESCYYYKIFDIGMTILGNCIDANGKLNSTEAKSLLHGYSLTNNLSDIEKSFIPHAILYAAVATTFWRHRQFNHYYPESTLHNSYQEMQNIADQLLESNLESIASKMF